MAPMPTSRSPETACPTPPTPIPPSPPPVPPPVRHKGSEPQQEQLHRQRKMAYSSASDTSSHSSEPVTKLFLHHRRMPIITHDGAKPQVTSHSSGRFRLLKKGVPWARGARASGGSPPDPVSEAAEFSGIFSSFSLRRTNPERLRHASTQSSPSPWSDFSSCLPLSFS